MKKLLLLSLLLCCSQAKPITSVAEQKSMINFLAIHALSATAGYIGLNLIARGLFLALNIPYPFDKNIVISCKQDEDAEYVALNRQKGGLVSVFGAVMLAAGIFGIKYSFENALRT
jgi:hypothetical protein